MKTEGYEPTGVKACTLRLMRVIASDIISGVSYGYAWRPMATTEPFHWMEYLGYRQGAKMMASAVPYIHVLWRRPPQSNRYPLRLYVFNAIKVKPFDYLSVAVEGYYTQNFMSIYLRDPMTGEEVNLSDLQINFYDEVTGEDAAGITRDGYHYYVGKDCNGISEVVPAFEKARPQQNLEKILEAFSVYCGLTPLPVSLHLSRDLIAYLYISGIEYAVKHGWIYFKDEFTKTIIYGAGQMVTNYVVKNKLEEPVYDLLDIDMTIEQYQDYIDAKGYEDLLANAVVVIYDAITLKKSFTSDQAVEAVKRYARMLADIAASCDLKQEAARLTALVPRPRKRIAFEPTPRARKYMELVEDLVSLGLPKSEVPKALALIEEGPDIQEGIAYVAEKMLRLDQERAQAVARKICYRHPEVCFP